LRLQRLIIIKVKVKAQRATLRRRARRERQWGQAAPIVRSFLTRRDSALASRRGLTNVRLGLRRLLNARPTEAEVQVKAQLVIVVWRVILGSGDWRLRRLWDGEGR